MNGEDTLLFIDFEPNWDTVTDVAEPENLNSLTRAHGAVYYRTELRFFRPGDDAEARVHDGTLDLRLSVRRSDTGNLLEFEYEGPIYGLAVPDYPGIT